MKAGIPSAVFRATLNYTTIHCWQKKYEILIFVGMTAEPPPALRV
jgi:hypothetical protein